MQRTLSSLSFVTSRLAKFEQKTQAHLKAASQLQQTIRLGRCLDKLPAELLACVLQFAQQSDDPMRSTLSLAHVNRHFRQTATSTPSLWTHITHCVSPDLLRLFLRNSGACGITLRLVHCGWNPFEVRSCFKEILKHTSRIESMDHHSSRYIHLVLGKPSVVFGALRRLILHLPDLDYVAKHPDTLASGLLKRARYPKLTYLSTKDYFLAALTATQDNVQNLTTLHLTAQRSGDPWAEPPVLMNKLMDALGQLPSLENLHLGLEDFGHTTASVVLCQTSRARVRLAKLRALVVCTSSDIANLVAADFVEHLDCPFLSTLKLVLQSRHVGRSHVTPGITDTILGVVEAMCHHRQPFEHLETFALFRSENVDNWVANDGHDLEFEHPRDHLSDRELLSLMPNLRDLTLGYIVPEKTISLLGASSTEWHGALRHLDSLTIHENSELPGMLIADVVAKRSDHPELQPLRKVCFDKCSNLTPEVLHSIKGALGSDGILEAFRSGLHMYRPDELKGIIVQPPAAASMDLW